MQLIEIKGLGEKRLKMLADASIFNPIDLILHLPYKYIDTSKTIDWENIEAEEEVVFFGVLSQMPQTKYIKKGLTFVKGTFSVGDRQIVCTWFNQRFISRQLIQGNTYCILGKVKRFKNVIDIKAPLILPKIFEGQKIIPMYKPIKGLPQNVLIEGVRHILSSITVHSYLPKNLTESYNLIELNQAFRELHFPQNAQDIEIAGKSIAIENLVYRLTLFNLIKQKNSENRVFRYFDNSEKINEVIKSLPYKLTEGQQNALQKIKESLLSDRRANILIEGDVGCGKTIIAFLSLYFAVLSGYQGVIMAPTEILSKQHFMSCVKLLSDFNVNIEYLSGSQTKLQRDTSLFNIKNGVADIIIGTHALISESVTFNNLALVITDEQHRFGVNQRAELENKAVGSDCIVMSATPIPRTLALVLYGDLTQICITSMPPKKASVTTKIVPNTKIQDMYNYILEKAKNGEQSFIVCPRIEDEDSSLISAEKIFTSLKTFFREVGVGLLHGKMDSRKKSENMENFFKSKIKVLIATTVVEVGIDVPAATTMVIFNAERYGLSQLHQLRGRVGRGSTDSYCFLLYESTNKSTLERLDYFSHCSNGFQLAEYDFLNRGAGDFIGSRQHGESETLSNVKITSEIIEIAKNICDKFMQSAEETSKILQNAGDINKDYIKSLTLN